MRMLQVTGKFTEFFPNGAEDVQMSVATLEEKRWHDNQQHVTYWYCFVPRYRESWIERCKEKNFTVLVTSIEFEFLGTVPGSERDWSGTMVVQNCEVM